MSGRDWLSLATAFLIVVLAVRCVSRTMTDARFHDSRGLQASIPVITVPDSEHYSFAIMGDVHVGDTVRLKRVLADATAEGDAFIVLLGDITDGGDRPAFTAVQKAIDEGGFTGRVLPVVGNHDVFGDGWSVYRDVFGPSHYSTVIGNARVIAVDTADAALGAEQGQWLADELKLGGVRHRFVLSHYMPIVPGQRTYLRLSNETEAARMMKLLTDTGATAWLGAHYHSFITGRVENVDYVVAGGAGRRMPPGNDYFFAQVRVDGATVTYTKRIVP